MSALWSGTRAESVTGTQNLEPWRPIALVQVDIEALLSQAPPHLPPGDRVWVEVKKQGQIVGVLDARVGEDGLLSSDQREVAGRFSNVSLSTYMTVTDDLLPKASIVVPTICESPEELIRTVNSLLALDYPDFEILVVDNRTSDSPTPLPEFESSRVRTISERTRGASAARNKGIAMAEGEVVAFTDDDAVVDRNWLRVLGARFALSEEVEGIGGLVLPMELKTAPQLWFEEFYGGFSPSFNSSVMSVAAMKGTSALFPYAPGVFGAGCNMAFRRSTLQRMGGFNVSLGPGTPAKGGEDPALFIALALAGGTLAFEPAALVRHTHRRTRSEFMRQVFGYGTGLTAMYTALVARDPRQLIALLRRIPAGVRLLAPERRDHSSSTEPSYPRETIAYQLLGMAYGPVAYVRSAARNRWSK